MLRYEIGRTIRQTLVTLSFGLLLPLVYWINESRLEVNKPFSDYLEAGAMIMAFALVAKLSYSMFSGEDSNTAFEYLKTLPVPGWKLAGFKILPRLFVSILVIIGLNVLVSPAAMPVKEGVYLTAYEFPVLVLSLFSGFLLGIADRKNVVLVTLFLVPVFYQLMVAPFASGLLMDLTHSDALSWYIAMLIGFLPLAFLWDTYRKWDCSSGQERTGGMILRMTGPVALLLAISIYTFSSI